jgi:ADP-ribose pyrophosphatase YjhB (NUDIX family)
MAVAVFHTDILAIPFRRQCGRRLLHPYGRRGITHDMIRRAAFSLLRPYFRLTRGMTLGAQGVVIDPEERVLLVRHGYQPGWRFPGGGVEWRETLEQALARELFEETGVRIAGQTRLHGVFGNFRVLPSDHVALFIIHEWDQPHVPDPNREIAAQGFFPRDALPQDTVPPVRQRLAEIFEGAELSAHW